MEDVGGSADDKKSDAARILIPDVGYRVPEYNNGIGSKKLPWLECSSGDAAVESLPSSELRRCTRRCESVIEFGVKEHEEACA